MIDNINFIFPEILISIFLMMLLILGVFRKNSSSLIYNLSILTLVIILVLVLTFYHFLLGKYLNDFAIDNNNNSSKFYRIINEVPTIILIVVVFVVVFKPLI